MATYLGAPGDKGNRMDKKEWNYRTFLTPALTIHPSIQ